MIINPEGVKLILEYWNDGKVFRLRGGGISPTSRDKCKKRSRRLERWGGQIQN